MTKRPDGLLKAGLILNIVLSAVGIVTSLISVKLFDNVVNSTDWDGVIIGGFNEMMRFVLIVFGVILPAIGIGFSAVALNNPRYKIAAGVIGVLTNLVAGILILVGKYIDEPTNI